MKNLVLANAHLMLQVALKSPSGTNIIPTISQATNVISTTGNQEMSCISQWSPVQATTQASEMVEITY